MAQNHKPFLSRTFVKKSLLKLAEARSSRLRDFWSDHKSPLLAGTVASITGISASIGLVLSALNSLGASKAQASSAIFISVTLYGLLSIWLSAKYRMPISIVWSSTGAALLIASGSLGLAFSSVVGAFIFTGALILLTGIWPALGRSVSKIPKPIASAMLAGVIFNFCVAPFKSIGSYALIVVPAILVWLLLQKFSPVWSTPAAILIIFGSTAVTDGFTISPDEILPTLSFVSPTFDLTAILSIGIPLYLVNMASQNIPGIAIMKSFGYEVPFKAAMAATGSATIIGGLFGGMSLNLAAITAALNANDHAHKDSKRRWLSSVYGGIVYLLIALFSGATVAFVLAAPKELILAAAGIALIGTIIGALSSALEDLKLRLPAMVTFLVGTSGLTLFSISSAFWALVSGLLVWTWLNFKKKSAKEI
jgi:benzoate membrane transport protein